jgi:CRP-like cAMP-binding protein
LLRPEGLIDSSRHFGQHQIGRLALALRASRAESGHVSQNRLLARLSRADLSLLKPNLEPVDLPVRKQLHARNRRIEHVYFPESGLASIVANGAHALEIGIIGRDGMTGVGLVMDINDRPRHETYIQVSGKGQRLTAPHLREALEASPSFRRALLQYAHAFMTQMADTALSNGRHKIEERLARWLLLADERLDNNEIPLTHEFLGVMLGTARPGVTIALKELERRGWITHRRGVVTIIDRKGLVRSSNGAYFAASEK